jgi:hypothetical protein
MDHSTPEQPSLIGLLSAGIDVVTRHFLTLLSLWGICNLSSQILGFLFALATGLRDRAAITNALESHNFFLIGAMGLLFLIAMLLYLLGHIATIVLAFKAFHKQDVATSELLGESSHFMVRIGLLYLLFSFSAIIALSLSVSSLPLLVRLSPILPALYFFIRLSLSIFCIVDEDVGVFDGISHSWKILGSHLGLAAKTLIVLILVGFCAAVPIAVVEVGLRVIGPVGNVVANALQFMVSAWLTACMTRFYLGLPRETPTV